jgi:hypothetical protein
MNPPTATDAPTATDGTTTKTNTAMSATDTTPDRAVTARPAWDPLWT